jgi:uncharacterized HAD superfamily protein
MDISKASALELLDKIDEIDAAGSLISVLGGFSKILAIRTFTVELSSADKYGNPVITVSDHLYNEFAPKILNWQV